ncbi:helix-turn-helix domain-containing protein, partial [Escherichia coli]
QNRCCKNGSDHRFRFPSGPQFERDLLLERTHSGIARAKAAGKRFGRPSTLNEEQKLSVIARIKAGASISAIAREFNTTRQTILRVKAGQ